MESFCYERFISLSGSALYDYLEPYLGDPHLTIHQNDLKQLLSDIPSFDECHLVYAIELGPDRAPDIFSSILPSCLSHEKQTVRLAASRALERLPSNCVSPDLIFALKENLLSCPEAKHLAYLSKDMEQRMLASGD